MNKNIVVHIYSKKSKIGYMSHIPSINDLIQIAADGKVYKVISIKHLVQMDPFKGDDVYVMCNKL